MRRLVGVLLVCVALAGCSDGDGDNDGEQSTGTTTTETTVATGTSDSTTPDETEPTAPLPSPGEDLADGRHATYLEGVNVDEDSIAVDVIQFLTGEEANAAYQEETGETDDVPNDYYIRNSAQQTRTLSVTEAVRITVAWKDGEPGELDISFDELPGYLESRGGAKVDTHVFWITVEDGDVVRLEEQYLP